MCMYSGEAVNVIIARLQEMHNFTQTVETLILLLDVSRLLLEAASDGEGDEGKFCLSRRKVSK